MSALGTWKDTRSFKQSVTTETHAAEVEDEVWKQNPAFKNQEAHADLDHRALDRVR